MKHTFSTKFKRIIICCATFVCAFAALPASAVERHYYIRPFRNGDTVYYDNSLTHWGTVRIYLFNSTDQSHPFEWNERPSMTYVDNEIWKFDITDEYDIEGKGYDFLIFSDEYNDGGQKTIDLGFVGSGYAYKVDTWDGNICSGYWYLYDTSAVILKYVRQVREGDVIYFDNSEMHWDTDSIRIYLFNRVDGHDTPRTPWDDRPSMEHVDGDIYKYVVTDNPSLEDYPANHIIFTGTSNGGNAQTIDLGFIDTGYAYLPDSWQDSKSLGYWYVYDKTSLIDATNKAKAYMADLDCLPESDLSSLKYAIADAELAIDSEIPVETELFGNTEEYWNQADTEEKHLLNELQAMIDAYGDSPTICGGDDPDPDPDPDPDDPSDDPAEDDPSHVQANDNDIIVPNTGSGLSSGGQSASTSGGLVISGIAIVMAITGAALVKANKR